MSSPEEARQYPPEYFNRYESPLSNRYGSDEMHYIWSELNRWRKVRQVWLAVARVQNTVGLVSGDELADLEEHVDDLDVQRIFQLEKQRGHDVMAAAHEYGEKALIGGRKLHQGLTSEDPLSNSESLRYQEAFGLILKRVDSFLITTAERVEETASIPCVGFTHIQAAEPITVGLRLANYGNDMLNDRALLQFVRTHIKAKGIKGAVGTFGSLETLLEGTGMTPQQHEELVMKELGLEASPVTTQTHPRKYDAWVVMGLASVAESLYRFANNYRLLHSSLYGEWHEPRKPGQIGSSAMPWKQNPVTAEKIISLSRGVKHKLQEALEVEEAYVLERSLDDSAGRRSWMPESFIIIDECLTSAEKIMRGMVIDQVAINRNMNLLTPFASQSIIMGMAAARGADRQELHNILLSHAETATKAIRQGKKNPLKKLMKSDEEIRKYLTPEEIEEAFTRALNYIGSAPEIAHQLVSEIRQTVPDRS